jgi:capsid protein
MFQSLQKLVERLILDFVYPQILDDAIARGTLSPVPDALTTANSWTALWPAMPILDPLDEIEAFYRRIRYGQSNFDLELGPEREAIHKRLAENMKFLRDNGLENLPYFATASGAPVTTEPAPAKKRG